MAGGGGRSPFQITLRASERRLLKALVRRGTAEYRQVYAQGWPLKAVYHGEGGGAGRAVVMKVESRDIPDREFAPPAGFRAAPLAEILGLSGR